MAQNLYRSARGKMVDMAKLSIQHELTPAVSNVRMNARGDLLGADGQIIKHNETVFTAAPTGVPVQTRTIPESVAAPAKSQYIANPITTPAAPTPAPFVSSSTELMKAEDLQFGIKDKNKGKA
jgi:hypothetical protein